jgi:large subunit ribosomal protein L11
MAKKIIKKIKLQIAGGKANPAPPLGPALGQAGVNIGEFVNQFNAKTKEMMGEVLSTEITVYDDRSFTFILKSSPATSLIKKAAGIESGSGKNTQKKAGSITREQVREIALKKMEDLNATEIEAAMKIIEGSCRSMGVEVKG